MKTVSYTNMRDHLAEIMEEVAQGEEVCFTRKGHEPFVFKKVRTPTDQELESAKILKREKTIEKLKSRHAKTLDLLADK